MKLNASVGLAALAAVVSMSADAAPFGSGNLVIYRVGTGAAALNNSSTAVFIDEFTSAGVPVQSLPLPTALEGGNSPLTASGSATSEGLMTRSVDGRYLMLTGYASAPGVSGIAATASATVGRTIGRIDAAGGVDTSTVLSDFADANNPRSVVSVDGSEFWAAGAGGARYASIGATTSTLLSTTITNLRQLEIFGGQLYVSNSSGSNVRIGAVGAGLPTTSGQVITGLPGFATSGSPYGFFMCDLSDAIAGLDTLYVADDGSEALRKYTFDGAAWVLNGTIGAGSDDYRSVTGVVNGSEVTLYAVRKASELVSLTDASGYNGAFAGTPTLLATAGANTAFRSVAFAPVVPEPGTLSVLGISAVGLLVRRRKA